MMMTWLHCLFRVYSTAELSEPTSETLGPRGDSSTRPYAYSLALAKVKPTIRTLTQAYYTDIHEHRTGDGPQRTSHWVTELDCLDEITLS